MGEVNKKTLIATVIKDKMQKSRVVVVEGIKKDNRFHKYVKTRKKYIVHDENEESRVGDLVLLEPTRPLSKMKRMKIVSIIKKYE